MRQNRTRLWIPEAPLINLRRYKEVGLIEPATRLRGRFFVDLIHARTGDVVRHLEFDNLIVDAGLEAIVTHRMDFMMFYCGVGVGTTAPAVTDVNLELPLVRTNSDGGIVGTGGVIATTYGFIRFTREFTEAQANDNLTEVGMFRFVSGAPMLCRQLFKDETGTPTTIVKTSEYRLRVAYEVRTYPVLTDVVYSALVNGAAQDITVRPAIFTGSPSWGHPGSGTYYGPAIINTQTFLSTAHTGALGAITGSPSGTSSSSDSVVASAYVANSRQRDVEITWGSGKANNTTLSFKPLGENTPHQHQLTTGVAKTSLEKLVLQVRNSWERYVIP